MGRPVPAEAAQGRDGHHHGELSRVVGVAELHVARMPVSAERLPPAERRPAGAQVRGVIAVQPPTGAVHVPALELTVELRVGPTQEGADQLGHVADLGILGHDDALVDRLAVVAQAVQPGLAIPQNPIGRQSRGSDPVVRGVGQPAGGIPYGLVRNCRVPGVPPVACRQTVHTAAQPARRGAGGIVAKPPPDAGGAGVGAGAGIDDDHQVHVAVTIAVIVSEVDGGIGLRDGLLSQLLETDVAVVAVTRIPVDIGLGVVCGVGGHDRPVVAVPRVAVERPRRVVPAARVAIEVERAV